VLGAIGYNRGIGEVEEIVHDWRRILWVEKLAEGAAEFVRHEEGFSSG